MESEGVKLEKSSKKTITEQKYQMRGQEIFMIIEPGDMSTGGVNGRLQNSICGEALTSFEEANNPSVKGNFRSYIPETVGTE